MFGSSNKCVTKHPANRPTDTNLALAYVKRKKKRENNERVKEGKKKTELDGRETGNRNEGVAGVGKRSFVLLGKSI